MKKLVIIIMFILVFLLPLFLNEESKTIITANANENKMLNESNTFSYDVTVENSIVPYGNEIHISFTLNNEASNQEVSVINSSFTLLDRIITDDDEIDVYVTNNHTAGEYFFEVEAEDENDISFTQSIYIYSDGIRDCVSTSCIEDAKDIYFCNFVATQEQLTLLNKIEQVDNMVYTTSYYETINTYEDFVYKDGDIECIATKEAAAIDGLLSITGTIQWIDNNGNLHPLVNNVVYLCDSEIFVFEVCGFAKTNEFGEFSFTISNQTLLENGGRDLYVAIYPQNDAAYVESENNNYIYTTPIFDNVADNTLMNYDIIINCGESTRANAYQIAQMMHYSQVYIHDMSYELLPAIEILYPNIKDRCFFCDDPVCIVMDKRAYYSWDVGMHEYGHYVDYYFNLSYLQDGPHWFGKDLSYHYGKVKGLRLAYTEALATYLSISAQFYLNLGTTGIPTVGNYSYNAYNGVNANGLNYGYGESDEGSIFGLLLTLADSVDRTYDDVALGYDVLWEILDAKKRDNISELLTDIVNQYPNFKNELGLLFERFGFAPLNATASVDILDTSNYNNILSWNHNRVHVTETASELDQYSLVFYAEDYLARLDDPTCMYQIDNITTTSYTLTANDFNSILSLSGDVVYWQVLGYNTKGPDTGPYNSSLKEISKITGELELDDGLDGSVGVLESVWYKFTAPALSKYAFFTTGNCDTYGELFPAMVPDNTFTNKYSGDDNSGDGYNFRIVYSLTPGQVVYLRVSRLPDSETDDFTLCVQHVHEYVYRSVNARFHILKCHCGATSGSNEAHVINGSYSPPDGNTRYKPCIGCGEMIDTWAGGVFPIIKNNVIAYVTYQNRLIGDELLDLTITETNMSAMVINGAKYSANGSYMLLDGTAVLVEDDVDAYFAGTLVFYEQDEIPLTE